MHEQLTSFVKNEALSAFSRLLITSLSSTKTTPWVPLLLMWYITESWSTGSVPSALQAKIILLVPYTSSAFRGRLGREAIPKQTQLRKYQ